MATETLLDILDGPSKFDLMLAVFDNTGEHPRTVSFSCKHSGSSAIFKINVDICLAGHEDGSGECWIFEGVYRTNGKRVKGFFRTNSRKGHITVET